MESLVDSRYWNNRNVFVTGASGLVGSCLVQKLLTQKANVFALVSNLNPQSEFVRSGIINKTTVINGMLEDYKILLRALAKYEITDVFHLAAQPLVGAAYLHPLETFETNIRGTYNLLEACRANKKLINSVIVASSDKAYGNSDTLPYLENMPPLGRHPYDVSKSCGDLLAHTYFHTYGLPVVITRCGNIFGEGDLNWSRIVPGTIKSCFFNLAPIIRSDGKYLRDYIYVKDVVNGYLFCSEKINYPNVSGQAFNFGPGKPHAVIEIVKIILDLMNKNNLGFKIENNAAHEIKNQYLSSEKAQSALGWKQLFSLEEALGKTIEWYRKFFEKQNN